MKLEDIAEVKYATSEEEINQALRDGFTIIDKSSVKIKHENVEEVKRLWVLAKAREIKEIIKKAAKRKGIEIIG